MSKQTNKHEIEHEKGSENVFADLGFENPEEELFKADLTAEIASLIKKRKLTQARAASLFGVSQPRISSLLRGRFDLFSVETLMSFLTALDQDIQVVIRPKPSRRKRAYLRVCTTSSERVMNVPVAAKTR